MKIVLLSAAALCLAASTPVLFADAIPYPQPGTVAPEVITTASGNGGVQVYFAGSNAGGDDSLAVFDVQTGYNSGYFFPGHETAMGTELTLGAGAGQINAGDQLVFFITNTALPSPLASIASYSADGYNHAYITSFSGGQLGSVAVPAGLYVGMEDLPVGLSDLDYNDDTLVFTGVTGTAVTPEPNSLLLLGTGVFGSLAMFRRRLLGR